MIRILQIGMSTNPGGVESFIMNIYRNIDRTKIQFDFLVDHNISKIAYEEEITKMGGRIFKEYYRRKEILCKGRKSIKKFLKEHPEINGVHMHANRLDPMFKVLIIAKKMKLKKIILHSHNDGYMKEISLKDKLYEKYAKKKIRNVTTKLLACSEEAGKWMFGNEKFEVINNSIDINDYTFDANEREKARIDLNVSKNEKIIGTVTRLNYQKNPQFLVRIFEEIYKKNNNVRLLIVGDGDLRDEITNLIKEMHLKDKVFLVGVKKDIRKYLSAMDCFVFPSRFEGFGIAPLEAQVAGLKCYCSDNVPRVVDCTGKVRFISLDKGVAEWAKIIEEDFENEKDICRIEDKNLFFKYNIKNNIKNIEKIYKGE